MTHRAIGTHCGEVGSIRGAAEAGDGHEGDTAAGWALHAGLAGDGPGEDGGAAGSCESLGIQPGQARDRGIQLWNAVEVFASGAEDAYEPGQGQIRRGAFKSGSGENAWGVDWEQDVSGKQGWSTSVACEECNSVRPFVINLACQDQAAD